MSSILTNAAAMTALQTLKSTNKTLNVTQSRISTGMRVSEASHNAAYWSIATIMRSDNKANSVVQDALGLGAGKVDTAYTAMEQSMEVVDQLKEKVLLAKTSEDEDRVKIQSEIEALQDGLRDSIGNATYAGSNLLQSNSDTADTAETVISSYNRDGEGNVTTGTINITLANVRLIDDHTTKAGVLDTEFTTGGGGGVSTSLLGLDITEDGLDDDDFDDILEEIESALAAMAGGAAELGAAKSRIEIQTDFVSVLSDAIDRGIGQLVDANMEEESTRLQALQTQQQLGIQSLSIANANSQNILALFGN